MGGECLRAEGKRSAKAPHPTLRLKPFSPSFGQALLRFWAVARPPSPGRFHQGKSTRTPRPLGHYKKPNLLVIQKNFVSLTDF